MFTIVLSVWRKYVLMIFTVLIFLAILASGGAAIMAATEDGGAAFVALIICGACIGLFLFLLNAQGYLDKV